MITLQSCHTPGHHWGGKEKGTEDVEKATRGLWIKRADRWLKAAGTQAGT